MFFAGQSIEEWEAAGWINYNFDPRGWFQWYTRFYQGRRCDDDERQVGRWRRCVGQTGRWKGILLKRYNEKGIRGVHGDDAEEVSPVVHQICDHVFVAPQPGTDLSGRIKSPSTIWTMRGRNVNVAL